MPAKFNIYTLGSADRQDIGFISQLISDGENPEIYAFESPKALMDVVSSGVEGKTAIIAVPMEFFNDAKLLLMKKLEVKIYRSSKILRALGNNTDIPDYIKHVAIPEGGTVFVSQDGLYSAVAFRLGETNCLLTPSEKDRFEYTFESGAFRLFRNEKTEAQKLKESVAGIEKSLKKIAISTSGKGKALLTVINAAGAENAFIPSDGKMNKNKENKIPYEAKRVKEKTKSDFGACISEIKEGTVTVSVANSEFASVAEVHTIPGESEKQLLTAAVVKLCEMMNDASNKGINPPEEKPSKKLNKGLLIAIACIIVAVIVCGVIGAVVYAKNSDGEETNQTTVENVITEETVAEETETTEEGRNDDGLGEVGPAEDETEDEETEEESITEKLTTILTTLAASVTEKTTKTTTKTTTKAATTKATTTKATTKATTTKATTTKASTTKTTTKASTTKATTKATTTKETTKATTTKTETTSKKSEDTATTSAASGTFTFDIYGYGHGVGMSQDGAIAMAKSGSSYSEIIQNYYPGTYIAMETKTVSKYITEPETKVDETTGETIVVKEGYTLLEFLCKTVKQEIGAGAPLEALKAQAVCAYTYACTRGRFQANDGQAYDASFKYQGTNVEKACMAILCIEKEDDEPHPMYVCYNGDYAKTYYFANCAGKTVPATTVWSGSAPAYLSGGCQSPETPDHTTVTVTAEQFRKIVTSYNKANPSKAITLGDDPSTWLKITSKESIYKDDAGYVNKITVGDKTMTGNQFRTMMRTYTPSDCSYNFKSHCFSLKYSK